jgi:hypothetical protein
MNGMHGNFGIGLTPFPIHPIHPNHPGSDIFRTLNFNYYHLRSVGLIILMGLLAISGNISGQIRVSGRVYDMTQSIPLPSVSVLSTAGTGTVTDSTGRYMIMVGDQDSIWFSYLGKPTPKYAVQSIVNIRNFEISLHVNVTELPKIVIQPRDYRRDSIQNRIDYADAFNFKKPGIGSTYTPGGPAGLDLAEFISMFQFRRNKRMVGFRERLLREEQDKFIEHRFSRALVIKLTGIRGPELDSFMVRYKPDLLFTMYATDYEISAYIKESHIKYVRWKQVMGQLRKEDE